MAVDYADKQFWDARYSQGPSHVQGIFDWFPSKSDQQDPLLLALEEMQVSKAGRILDIGCGNSSLCEKLSQEGFSRVIGIDYSKPVTELMRERERKRRSQLQESTGKQIGAGESQRSVSQHGVIHYHCMDATSLSFSDASFDAVLDKGLIDSIMSGNSPTIDLGLDRKMLWKRLHADKKSKEGGGKSSDPAPPPAEQDAEQWGSGSLVLAQVRRVLKEGGVYLVVSYESPERRMPLLRSIEGWVVTWSHFEAQQDWYLYRCSLGSSDKS